MRGSETRDNTLDSVVEDIYSILPLLCRTIHRKFLRNTFSRIDENLLPPHFEIMRMLQEAGTLHISEIGDELLISRPQMTYLIDRLVNLNLVERRPDPSDRRTINVCLTDEGKSIVRERIELVRGTFKAAISRLSIEELGELSASLKKLREMLTKLQ